jgi:ATP-dependent DNA helicase RecG
MNSYCHRLATRTQNNEVALFKNRIEIYNPGAFPTNVTPEDYITGTARSAQRNPLLAQIMYYSKDIERFGTGLKRIHDACVEAGVEYKFRREVQGFTTVFFRPKNLILDPVTGKVIGGNGIAEVNAVVNPSDFIENFIENFIEPLTKTEKETLRLIYTKPSNTTAEFAALLNITSRAMASRIKNLKDKGIIIREGSDRQGYWKLTNLDLE